MSDPDITPNPTGIVPGTAYEYIPNLGASLDGLVAEIPDGQGTCTDGTVIYLERRYVNLIGRTALKAKRRVGIGPIHRAKAIYYLLHEHGHVLQHRKGDIYKGVASELEANTHAAAFFRRYCTERLGLTQAEATKLWKALPSWYRKPEAV